MIRSNLLPSLDALRAEYEGRIFRADELCDEFRMLVHSFKECFLTSEEAGASEKELTDRLLRHYVGEGLLSAPIKDGHHNGFGLQHLLELLAVRRLQAERALTLIGMKGLVRGKSLEYLYQLLTRGSHLQVEPTPAEAGELKGNASALQAIREIKESGRAMRRPTFRAQEEGLPGLVDPAAGVHKVHHLVAPGLELVMADSFQRPATRTEERRLMEKIKSLLEPGSSPGKTR